MDDLHEFVVRSLLECGRPQWQAVADATGVSVHTIIKIARRDIASPRYRVLAPLADHFRTHPAGQRHGAAA